MSAAQQVFLGSYATAFGGLDPSWANVVLALHGDGTDASTTIVDQKGRSSPTSSRGTSAISTTQSQFGGASIRFNFDGGLIYQTGSAHADFQFAGDFTIRFWVYVDASAHTGVARVLYDCRRNGGDASGFVFYINPSDGLSLYSGTTYYLNQTATTFPTGQWVHVAIARAGSSFRIFQAGAIILATGLTTNFSSGRCCIGEVNPEYQGTTALYGYMDDIEVVNGEAVYNAAYTPPSAAFPNS